MIQTLNSSHYAGQLTDPEEVGLSPLFRGHIRVKGDERVRCYIKPMPDNIMDPSGRPVENREVLNEALGYTLAKSLGYAVPAQAGVIVLDKDLIPPRAIDLILAATPGGKLQEDYLAWFSQDMLFPSLLKKHISDAPQYIRNQQMYRLAKALSEHVDAHRVVVFDEWTENSDRNLGNLLDAENGRLAMIDHGRIFRAPAWSPAKLRTNPYALNNKIRELIDIVVPHWSEKTPSKSARLLEYQNLAHRWRSHASEEARHVLEEFINPAEALQVVGFLDDRLEPTQYSKAVGLLV